MAFCGRCGAYIAEGAGSCPACGWDPSEFAKTYKTTGSASAAQAAPEPEPKKQPEPPKAEAPRRDEKTGAQQQEKGAYNYNYTYNYNYAGRERGRSRYSSQNRAENSGSHYSSGDEGFNSRHDGRGGWADSEADAAYADPYDARKNRSAAYLCYFGLLFLVPYFLRPDSEFVRFHANQGLLMLLFAGVVSVFSALPILGWLASCAGWVLVVVMFFRGISAVRHGLLRELPIIGKIRILK